MGETVKPRFGLALGMPLEGHRGVVNSVAFIPDGETIVSGGFDGTMRLWDRSGQALGTPLEGHITPVISVAFSPDGETIVSGGFDGTVRLWDRSGQALGMPFEGHGNSVNSVAFSPDGETIVSGGFDGTVRLWPIRLSAGWIPYTCDSLRGYLQVRSQTDEVAREAHRTCERYA